MTAFSRRAGLVFVVLLVVDTLAITVLALMQPSEWGIVPIIFPVVLGFVGLVVFNWAPRLRPSRRPEDQMSPVVRLTFRVSLVVIALSQAAAVLIALACLAAVAYLVAAG